MKTGLRFLSFYLLMLFVSYPFAHAITSEDTAQFQAANKAYRDAKYKEALAGYSELSRKNPDEAVFYYNLGNTFQRLGDVGQAILAYERALKFSPRDNDIRTNLNYVSGLTEYRMEDKRNWYLRAAEKALNYFTEKEINFAGLFFLLLFLLSWACAIFFKGDTSMGWKRKMFLIMLLAFGLIFAAKNFQTRMMSDAIVMSKDTPVRYGPSEKDQVAFRLGEGMKVYLLEKRDDWSRVLLPNGNTGWLANSNVAEVRK